MDAPLFRVVADRSSFSCMISGEETEFKVTYNGRLLNGRDAEARLRLLNSVAEAFVTGMEEDEGADGADFGALRQAKPLKMSFIRSQREVKVSEALASAITTGIRQLFPPKRKMRPAPPPPSIYGKGIIRESKQKTCYANSALTLVNDPGVADRLKELDESDIRTGLARLYSTQARGQEAISQDAVTTLMGQLEPVIERNDVKKEQWGDSSVANDLFWVFLALHKEMDLPKIPRRNDALLTLKLRYLLREEPAFDKNNERLTKLWNTLQNIARMQDTPLFQQVGTTDANYLNWNDEFRNDAAALCIEVEGQSWQHLEDPAFGKAALEFVLEQLQLPPPDEVDLDRPLLSDRMQAVQVQRGQASSIQKLIEKTTLQRDLVQADRGPPSDLYVYLERKGATDRVSGMRDAVEFTRDGRDYIYNIDKIVVLSEGHYYVLVRKGDGWLQVDDDKITYTRKLPNKALTHSYMVRLKQV